MGHACGHCASGSASVLSALALNAIKEQLPFGVDIISTPDEEINGAKCIMADQGIFDAYDFAIMVHMGGANLIDVNFIALDGLQFIWTGVAAHAASAPEQGRNALNAARLFMDATDMMRQHKRICEESFAAVIDRLNASYAEFRKRTGRPVERLPWKEKVVTFGELYQEACASGGEAFAAAFAAEQKQLRQELEQGRIYMIEANFRLIDRIYDYIEDISPRIVYGLMPPYYPNVLNCYFADMAPEAQDMSGKLNCYTKERYGQEYDREYFYTGICDLSYINIEDPEEQRKRISQSMPLFGWYYDIPFEEIKKISMAGINIGPWGKDFHKLTERVLMENLYDRTPHILDHAITILLG